MQMTCAECYVRQGEKNQAGTNVLLCTDPTHKKISKDRLIELSAQLFPGFSQSVQESMALSCSDLDAVKTNSQDLQLESYFNPETGEKEYMDSRRKISQSVNQAVYLMQVMKLGEVECLVMFDTGSNINIINGNLAEMLDLQVIDRQVINCQVFLRQVSDH